SVRALTLPSFPTRRSSDLEFAGETELLTLLAAPAPAILAADAHVHLADGHRPARIADQPALEQRRRRVRLVHELTRGFEAADDRSEEHTSELQSRENLVCR